MIYTYKEQQIIKFVFLQEVILWNKQQWGNCKLSFLKTLYSIQYSTSYRNNFDMRLTIKKCQIVRFRFWDMPYL